MKDFEGAIADFKEVIKLDPKSVSAYYDMGSAKIQLKDLKGAKEDFDKSIALNNKFAPAYFNRAMIEYTDQNYEKAVKDYSVYISLVPDDAEAYNNRALARMHIGGETKNAIYDCLKALKLNPDYLPRYQELDWLKYYLPKPVEETNQ